MIIDKKAVEEKKDENKALFDMLQKFEKADSIDKGKCNKNFLWEMRTLLQPIRIRFILR